MSAEPLHIEAGFARTFDFSARPSDHANSEAVELHLSYGPRAQVSAKPDRTGFLIRVWAGPDVDNVMTVLVDFDEAIKPVLSAFRWAVT